MFSYFSAPNALYKRNYLKMNRFGQTITTLKENVFYDIMFLSLEHLNENNSKQISHVHTRVVRKTNGDLRAPASHH